MREEEEEEERIRDDAEPPEIIGQARPQRATKDFRRPVGGCADRDATVCVRPIGVDTHLPRGHGVVRGRGHGVVRGPRYGEEARPCRQQPSPLGPHWDPTGTPLGSHWDPTGTQHRPEGCVKSSQVESRPSQVKSRDARRRRRLRRVKSS
jgi:hypothetical protein